ncbi:MAG: hypothetical protein ACE5F3_07865 [Mariprofundaceae bacterium]
MNGAVAFASELKTDASLPVGATQILLPKRVLIDVRSTHSDGAHDMDTLVEMAQERGIKVLAFTEHDRTGIRFGLAPVPAFLGYSLERPSLYTTGVQSFFSDLARMRSKYPHMGLIAGTESTPGYYWTGIPFRDLTLHEAERHIITLGIETPTQVEALPSYDLRHAPGHPHLSTMFWGTMIVIALLLMLRRREWGAALLGLSAFALLLLFWPADKMDADAEFIDIARQQGLFTIWAHPGTNSGVRAGPMGIQLDTPPYSKCVFIEPTADAFAAIYGDTDVNTVAGGPWDRYLMEYMQGRHAHPIWGVAAGDFHTQGEANEYLGNFPMDVWASSSAPQDVLSAMRGGHVVAWGLPKDRNLRMQQLSLTDERGAHLIAGDENSVYGGVTVHIRLVETPAAIETADTIFPAELIVDGKVAIHPMLAVGELSQVNLQLAPGAHVVRLRIAAGAIRMVANPFLLRVFG